MIGLLLTIAIVGFVVYLIIQIPMVAPFRQIIIALAVLLLVLYLLSVFGVADIPVPHLRR